MKLIIGLGNPDKEYENSRHNIGFMMVDFIASKIDAGDFKLNKGLNALIAKGKIKNKPVILAKPQTYVNKSGEAVKKLATSYKLQATSIVVIHDDLDIEFGSFKFSFGKNSGGHKGVESVIKSLKTKDFHRIRFGLGTAALQRARRQSDKKRDEFVRNYVLSKFTPKETEALKKMFKEAYERFLVSNF